MLAVLLIWTATTINGAVSKLEGVNLTTSPGVTSGEPCDIATMTKKFGYIQVSNNNKYFYIIYEPAVIVQSSPVFIFFGGGPGASSVSMAVSATGPCVLSIRGGTKNRYSWSEKAIGIWVDAPGPTGFSVGPVEQTLQEAIDNMLNFIKGVFKKYPYMNQNVHLVGYSASGTYVAMLGMELIKPRNGIQFRGVMINAGGIVGPHQLFEGCPQMIKNKQLPVDPYKMTVALGACHQGIAECNSNGPGGSPNPPQCQSASLICRRVVHDPVVEAGISVYDIRAVPGDDAFFFKLQTQDPKTFLNSRNFQASIGVSKEWVDTDKKVHEAFLKYIVYDTTFHLAKILDAGKKVLMVAGESDYITNAVGTLAWMSALKGVQRYGDGFNKSPETQLQFPEVGTVGTIKSSKYTNGAQLAFIKMSNAGHFLNNNEPMALKLTLEHFLFGKL